ncbi:hypothetical protein Tco_0119259, partial [Tanacetum coccineum]
MPSSPPRSTTPQSPPKGCDGFFRPIKGACGLPEKAPRVRLFVLFSNRGAFVVRIAPR